MIASTKTKPNRAMCTPADVLREVIEANRQMVLNRAALNQSTPREDRKCICFLMVNELDIRGVSRHAQVVRLRHTYAALARRFTDASWPEIARAIGKRSHSSMITAVKILMRGFETDPELRRIYGAACLMLAARNRIGIRVDEGVEPGEVALWRRWARGDAEGTPRVVDQGLGTGVGSGVPTNA